MLLSWLLCLVAVLGPQSVLLDSQQPYECGGRFNTSEFQLTSPDFPENTDIWEQCVFEVHAATESVCGLDIDFSNIDLPACPSEWLKVDDQSVCDSNERFIHIPFHQSPINITFRKIQEKNTILNMTVRQVECSEEFTNECGGQFSDDTVTIHSPGYPSEYSENLHCPYTIISTDSSVCMVEISFNDSALEPSHNCFKDSLTLGMYRMCGSLEGTVVLKMEGEFNILFSTDNKTNNKGFNMTVRQKRCPNIFSVSEPLTQNEKQDFEQHLQFGNTGAGYPKVERPFPSFPLPNSLEEQQIHESYIPPHQRGDQNPLEESPVQRYPPNLLHECILQLTAENNQKPPSVVYRPSGDPVNEIYVFGNQNPLSVPKFQNNEPQFGVQYEKVPPEFLIPRPAQNVPLQNYRPFKTQQTLPPPLYPSVNEYFPFPPSMTLRTIPSLQQCCGEIYSDSHFLLVSPNFPQSKPSNCIYTIRRFSPTTTEVRLQFRFFLVGDDTGEGCSGGFLEIDGTRICGCKNGLLWTSKYFDSEPSKILHLKLYPSNRKVINGFIIEVFQDDSYLQRFKRFSSESDKGSLVNVNQYVETIIERGPIFQNRKNDPLLAYPILDPTLQTSGLRTETECLRWTIQNWPNFVKTILWSKNQCPTSNNDLVLTTACRSCQYFCRQNCKCC